MCVLYVPTSGDTRQLSSFVRFVADFTVSLDLLLLTPPLWKPVSEVGSSRAFGSHVQKGNFFSPTPSRLVGPQNHSSGVSCLCDKTVGPAGGFQAPRSAGLRVWIVEI